jgi:hypothetical protein
MDKREAGSFILCILAFVLGCMVVLSMGCKATGAIRVSTIGHVDVDHTLPEHYSYVKQRPKTKSWRKIIKEILERKKNTPLIPDNNNTYPIPLYDSLDWDKMKNLA